MDKGGRIKNGYIHPAGGKVNETDKILCNGNVDHLTTLTKGPRKVIEFVKVPVESANMPGAKRRCPTPKDLKGGEAKAVNLVNEDTPLSGDSNAFNDIVHTKADMLELVKDLTTNLVEGKGEKWEAIVYARPNFAMAIVGKKGAVLTFADNSAKLDVPAGALQGYSVIYFWRPVNFGNATDKVPLFPVAPMIHLGPEGTKFMVAVKLTFGHCVHDPKDIKPHTVQRPNAESEWVDATTQGTSVTVSGASMTVSLMSFTDVVPGYHAGPRSMTIVTMVRRQETGGMTVDIYLFQNVQGFLQNVVTMLGNSYGVDEIRIAESVIVDTRYPWPVSLHFNDGALVALQGSCTFPPADLQRSSGCHTSFACSRAAANPTNRTLLGSLSVSQEIEGTKLLANVMINDTGHALNTASGSHAEPFSVQVHEPAIENKAIAQVPDDAKTFAQNRRLATLDGKHEAHHAQEQTPTTSDTGRRSRHASGVGNPEVVMSGPNKSAPSSQTEKVGSRHTDKQVSTTKEHKEKQSVSPRFLRKQLCPDAGLHVAKEAATAGGIKVEAKKGKDAKLGATNVEEPSDANGHDGGSRSKGDGKVQMSQRSKTLAY